MVDFEPLGALFGLGAPEAVLIDFVLRDVIIDVKHSAKNPSKTVEIPGYDTSVDPKYEDLLLIAHRHGHQTDTANESCHEISE